jgi:hypothetical protein
MLELEDADALRSLLDLLNEEGVSDRLSGIDSLGEPFLACLAGVYADTVRVLVADPADTERDQAPYCDECGQATNRLGLDALHYPVVVVR